MAATSYILAAIIVLVGLIAGYIYTMGIPPEVKRKMEEKALETMGENKTSYMMKDALKSIPTSDQKEVTELRDAFSKTTGGALQNPLGRLAGDTADEAFRPVSGR